MGHVAIPSYRSGFYSPKRGGVPKYPSLWRGCVGAWCPSLGQTGLRLMDQSVYGNHGTLTNMDAASDWVTSGGRVGLKMNDNPGSDHVSVNTTFFESTLSGPITLSTWFRYDAAPLNLGALLGNNADAVNKRIALMIASDGTLYWDYGGASGGSSRITHSRTWNVGEVYHVVSVIAPGLMQIHINGLLVASQSASTTRTLSGNSLFYVGYFLDRTFHNYNPFTHYDVRVYNRVLTASEIRTLSTHRGIAYELNRSRNRYPVQSSGSNRRRRLICGANC